MESLLARALESKLRYWLRSFAREQFKLQGRTVQLCNLDINGEALHATIGLPPTLLVQQARVGRLEIKLPSFSNVQVEPIVVEIDKLDLVLVEKSSSQLDASPCGAHTASVSARSSGYGFADKIADGMTLQVGIVNLMLETRGGAGGGEGAAWTPPLASITMHKLSLYTTNEYWQVVNLKEARDFSSNKRCIYVFKKLQWESMSADLLPHPNMFNDERLSSSKSGILGRDNDGAKRLFFGGERFLDNISGEAHITMQRTEQNNPLGLEVQVHLPEAVCPALSEPGLRALLRFMTGLYVCMNREDVGPRPPQSSEAAGHTIVAVIVQHIFLCIKDSDFQLELLLQCLNYTRVTTPSGESTKTMTRIGAGGFFLRDTFSFPPCTLVQPRMQNISNQPLPVPKFASERLWPRIYPLGTQWLPQVETVPLLCMYSLQMLPSPAPPSLASQTVIQCQPLKINLQEESCLRIASFLADGVVVEHGVVMRDTSLDSMYFTLKEIDITIPVDKYDSYSQDHLTGFTGARLHVEGFIFAQAPSLSFRLLKVEEDPACFALWRGQPVDASQRRWIMRATNTSVSLETGICDDSAQSRDVTDWSAGLWRCVEILDPCIETAMVTADGRPLVVMPPPGGIVRFGAFCKQYSSVTSVEQLFFVLKMYEYIGKVSDALLKVNRAAKEPAEGEDSRNMLLGQDRKQVGPISSIVEMAPSDTAVSLGMDVLDLKFLESNSGQVIAQGPPLVQICGNGLSLMVTHRTLGAAVAISSKLLWHNIFVECVETDDKSSSTATHLPTEAVLNVNGSLGSSQYTCQSHLTASLPQAEPKSTMRAVFWTGEGNTSSLCTESMSQCSSSEKPYFLDIHVENILPYRAGDAECHSLRATVKVHGVRLGGGMVYNEALLHRFGILGPDGGPGKGVKRVLENLSSGPFASLLKPPQRVLSMEMPDVIGGGATDNQVWTLNGPDDISIDIQLQDWVFVLEGADVMSEPLRSPISVVSSPHRDEIFWQSTFQCFRVTALGGHKFPDSSGEPKDIPAGKHPVKRIIVAIDGLEVIKPCSLAQKPRLQVTGSADVNGHAAPWGFMDSDRDVSFNAVQQAHTTSDNLRNGGLDVEIRLVAREEDVDSDIGMGQWVVESLKASVKKPVEVEATKEEVDSLIILFKSEIESASRILAGIMQLLKLQGSIGQAAIDQLSSLGSGSLDRLVVPERARRRSSIGSISGASSLSGALHENLNLGSTISRLEQAVCKSQEICAKLNWRLTKANFVDKAGALLESTAVMQELGEMQTLLKSLRNEL